MDEQGNGQDDTSGAADDGDGGSGDPRFDALARRAGQALRRPAPAHDSSAGGNSSSVWASVVWPAWCWPWGR
ncbi:MAG: hypothetical protein IPL07_13520 [Acidimicrobiaceae bacterium]|nr:hypothetical protein [Acidimicrobiaceae bacterium]